jgi:hypothetical protein
MAGEMNDMVGDLPNDTLPGILALGLGLTNGANRSNTSVGSKVKADKVLGLDPNAKLASFYLVSGLPRVSRTLVFTFPSAAFVHQLTPGILRVVVCRHRSDSWSSSFPKLPRTLVAA